MTVISGGNSVVAVIFSCTAVCLPKRAEGVSPAISLLSAFNLPRLVIWILLCVFPPTYPASFPQPTALQDARMSRESSGRKTTSRSNPLESGRD